MSTDDKDTQGKATPETPQAKPGATQASKPESKPQATPETTPEAPEALKSDATPKKKRSLPRRILRWFGWTVGGVIGLILLLLVGATIYLQPSRLTPLLENIANDNLKAQVSIGRAELTFWSSFPKVKIHLDDVKIVSKSLDSLSEGDRAMLPDNAADLLAFKSLDGAIDVLHIFKGEYRLYDVTIENPDINLVQATEDVSNFDIFPPSEDTEETTEMPNFVIEHFKILNGGHITYVSRPDDIDIDMNLTTIELTDKSAVYNMKVASLIDSPMFSDFNYENFDFAMDGGIGWTPASPYELRLNDFKIKVADFDVDFSTELDFTKDLVIKQLVFSLNKLNIARLIDHAPMMLAEAVEPLDTDMQLTLAGRLTKPYDFGDEMAMPSFTLALNIPPCRFYYNDVRFNRLATNLTLNLDGDDLNQSSLTLDKLEVDGEAMDFTLQAKVTDLLVDPRISGSYVGSIDFSRLPQSLRAALDAKVSGTLNGNIDFDFHASDLEREQFHKMQFNGDLHLADFRFDSRDSVSSIYARRADLTFGSNERFQAESRVVDSLLIVRLNVDTLNFVSDGVAASSRNFAATVGTVNNFQTRDTTLITPIGGYVEFDRLAYRDDADSLRVRMSGAHGLVALQRFSSEAAKDPKLSVDLTINRLALRTPQLSTGIRNTNFVATANLRPRRNHNRKEAADSTTVASRSGRRAGFTREQLDSIGVDLYDFDVDNSMRSLLYRWDIRAQIRAERGRLRTDQIALRNSFGNLNLVVTTDSVALNSLDCRIGNSDFAVNGVVSNIRGALSRRRPRPLKFDLNVKSDTININQLVQAFTADTRHHIHSAVSDAELWGDAEIDAIKTDTDPSDSITGPLLIPVNIDAGFTIDAANVIYSNILLKDLHGRLLVYEGTVNLSQLSANTDIGNVDLNALYSAPTANNMNFGLGMKLDRVYIDRLPEYFPALDTIMPFIHSLDGIVDANIAVTSNITPDMYFDMPSLKAAMRFEGDSLVLFDNDTFRKMAKWLLFKNKNRNMVDHLSVEMTVADGVLNLYPFIAEIDRYKLGIVGHNTLDMKLDYHIAVLKSPIPFRFGIYLRGTPEKMKISFGGAKFKENMVARQDSIAVTARINLQDEMEKAFRRGVRAARLGPLKINAPADTTYLNVDESTFSAADSIVLIREGFIPAPPIDSLPATPSTTETRKRK